MASSSTQLAKPIFIEGVDNALSVVDAYTGQAKGVINSATNQFKAASGSILDALRHLNIKDNLCSVHMAESLKDALQQQQPPQGTGT